MTEFFDTVFIPFLCRALNEEPYQARMDFWCTVWFVVIVTIGWPWIMLHLSTLGSESDEVRYE